MKIDTELANNTLVVYMNIDGVGWKKEINFSEYTEPYNARLIKHSVDNLSEVVLRRIERSKDGIKSTG